MSILHSTGSIVARGVAMLAILVAKVARGEETSMIPYVAHQDGRHALMVDGKPFLILGAQVHNSSGWPAMLPMVWPTMQALHVNTVEIPVYWEQFEPEPGQFDPSVVDALLSGAREHKLRLVLLWFGTWKNGSNHYVPQWMKLAPEKYPNAMDARGRFIDSPSAICDAALQADGKAFTALMSHLKEADAQHTVIMVQVENETGMWGSVRDHSPAANDLFNRPVPAEALKAMGKDDIGMPFTWSDAFGGDADEYFQVWCTARYVGQVAAAGKAVYPLPMYVNASLRNPLKPGHPPKYQVGGPNDNVVALWKAAAPAIDIQSPDIYAHDEALYDAYFNAFRASDNPLFVPETINQGPATRFFYSALGHGALGYSPFGIDETLMAESPNSQSAATRFAAVAANYVAIAPMAREIAALNFAGKLHAAVEPDDPHDAKSDGTTTRSTAEVDSTIPPAPQKVIHCTDWDIHVNFGTFTRTHPTTRPAGMGPLGRVLVAELQPGQFLVTGQYTRLSFKPAGKLAGRAWQYLKVEEGKYTDGTFVPDRILNGDQTDWGVFMPASPTVVRVQVYTR